MTKKEAEKWLESLPSKHVQAKQCLTQLEQLHRAGHMDDRAYRLEQRRVAVVFALARKLAGEMG